MNFVLQKLGMVLSDKELAKLKEATLLKQVIGVELAIDRWLSDPATSEETLKI